MKHTFSALVVSAALFLTGCQKDRLTDEEIINDLSNFYGNSFEIVKTPTKNENGTPSDDEYLMKCSDGTEFTVKREWDRAIIGGIYLYYDNYVLSWLYERPELYSELLNSDLEWEKCEDGFNVKIGSYDDIAPAAELACRIVNGSNHLLPAENDHKSDFLYNIRPGIRFTGQCFDSGNTGDIDLGTFSDTEYLLYNGRIVFFVGGEPFDYDANDVIWQIEQKYVDEVREKKIDEQIPEEAFEKHGPPRLITDIGDLIRRDTHDEFIERVPMKTIYYIHTECEMFKNGEEQPPNFAYIEMWAAQAGYKCTDSGVGYYTLSDGSSTVTFHLTRGNGGEEKSDERYYVEKDGNEVGLQGGLNKRTKDTFEVYLTTDDLKTLFGLEYEFDFIGGKAKLIKKKQT